MNSRPIKITSSDITDGLQSNLCNEDHCYYMGDYTIGQSYAYSDTNQFILNLKKEVDKPETQLVYKRQAIVKAGSALASALSKPIGGLCLVPMPPSKSSDHPLYDDRIFKACMYAKSKQPKIEVVELLSQEVSRDSLHSGATARDVDALALNLKLSGQLPESCQAVFLVDDVIKSGASFKAAQIKIKEIYPNIPVYGFFLARCVRSPEYD